VKLSMVKSGLAESRVMADTFQPAGEGTIACVQRARERYYFLCKLSLEPTLTERGMTRMGTYGQTETFGGTQD
jgi:hypothetical protein